MLGQMTRKTASTASPGDHSGDGIFSRKSLLRRILRAGGLAVVLIAAVLFGGFLRFADSVATLRPPENPKADAIVVLTGGSQRIDQAVQLLERGSGRRLLISGVHPSTTSAQIRKMTQSSADLFSCCVDVGYQALDTIGNANEIAKWIHSRGYRSVLVVTNNYHMHRSLMELRRIDAVTQFIAYPVVNADLKSTEWYSEPNVLRTLLVEYAKTLFAYGRNLIGWGPNSGLRSASPPVQARLTKLGYGIFRRPGFWYSEVAGIAA